MKNNTKWAQVHTYTHTTHCKENDLSAINEGHYTYAEAYQKVL